MKKRKLLSYVSEGLATLVLAGTIFTSTGCATVYNYKPLVTAQEVVKKRDIGNLAVLLIDMQEYFLEDICDEEKAREVPYQLEVLDYCKKENVPVLVLEYEGCGQTISILKEKVDSLEKKDYIKKKHDDGFIDTDLAEKLRKNDIEIVLLMGIYASACVLQTGQGAISEGFKIITSKDLIANPKPIPRYIYNPSELSNESIDWYKANGTYVDNYKDLLDLISKKDCQSVNYF